MGSGERDLLDLAVVTSESDIRVEEDLCLCLLFCSGTIKMWAAAELLVSSNSTCLLLAVFFSISS